MRSASACRGRRSLPDADAPRPASAACKPPFAVKVVSREILHKSDAGGVTLNVADAAGVARAIATMAKKPGIAGKPVEGWLVEEMIPAGREIVIGGLSDPQFGPMIMVGLGGIFVEVLKDVSFRICPITRSRSLGHAGASSRAPRCSTACAARPPVDKQALVDIIMKVGGADGLMMQHCRQRSPKSTSIRSSCRETARSRPTRVSSCRRSKQRRAQPAPERSLPALEQFKPLFEPKTVAVLGASTKDVAIANTFIRRMKDFGYAGQIYPIHPSAPEIEGLKAYPSLGRTPEPIDYAYVAIGAERIPDAIAAANGRCRIAQVISSGFAEVEEGSELERRLVEKARAAGVRVLGPNTLGAYSPRGGLTFPQNAPKAVGTVGIVSQSGGLSTDIIKRGEWRGAALQRARDHRQQRRRHAA